MKQNDSYEKSREILNEEKTKYTEKMRLLFTNWTGIVSVSVVILSYLLYTYKYGICNIFHLPINAVSIRITEYVPVVVFFFGTVLYVIDCMVALRLQHKEEKTPFSLFRIFLGASMIYLVLYLILNDNSNNLFCLFLISIVPPLVIEFLIRSKSLLHVKEKVEKIFNRHWQTEEAEEKLFYKYYIRPGLICITIVILLTPFFSQIITKSKKVYEICTIDKKDYAVVLNKADDVVVQPAVIEADSLTIYTDSYRFVSRTDIDAFLCQRFKNVIITEGRNENDFNEETGGTDNG